MRAANRGSDIRVQIRANPAEPRWVDFTDTTAPRMTQGEGGDWVLDYGGEVPAGSWIFGAHQEDLTACGTLDLALYGINHKVSTDSVITVKDVVLTFQINGIPARRCEYQSEFKAALTEEHGPAAVRVRLHGPTPMRPAT